MVNKRGILIFISIIFFVFMGVVNAQTTITTCGTYTNQDNSLYVLNSNLTCNGNDAIIINSTNTTIDCQGHSITINSANNAISNNIASSGYINITNCTLMGNSSGTEGVIINPLLGNSFSNLYFIDNYVRNFTSNGVHILSLTSSTFINNSFINNGGAGIYLHEDPPIYYALQSDIYDNYIFNNTYGIRINYLATGPHNSYHNITDNEIHSNDYGINSYLSNDDYVISNNESFINNTYGIYLFLSDNWTINNNYFGYNNISVVINTSSGTESYNNIHYNNSEYSYVFEDADDTNIFLEEINYTGSGYSGIAPYPYAMYFLTNSDVINISNSTFYENYYTIKVLDNSTENLTIKNSYFTNNNNNQVPSNPNALDNDLWINSSSAILTNNYFDINPNASTYISQFTNLYLLSQGTAYFDCSSKNILGGPCKSGNYWTDTALYNNVTDYNGDGFLDESYLGIYPTISPSVFLAPKYQLVKNWSAPNITFTKTCPASGEINTCDNGSCGEFNCLINMTLSGSTAYNVTFFDNYTSSNINILDIQSNNNYSSLDNKTFIFDVIQTRNGTSSNYSYLNITYGVNCSAEDNSTIPQNTIVGNYTDYHGTLYNLSSPNSFVYLNVRIIKPNLTMVKSCSSPVELEDILECSINLTNHGMGKAYNTVLTDYYNSSLLFYNSSSLSTSDNMTYVVNNISSGSTYNFKINFTLNYSIENGTEINNTIGGLYCNGSCNYSLANSTSIATVVYYDPNISIIKRCPSDADIGQNITCNITISLENGKAHNLTIYDTYSEHLIYNGDSTILHNSSNSTERWIQWNVSSVTHWNDWFTNMTFYVNSSAGNATQLNNSVNVTYYNLSGSEKLREDNVSLIVYNRAPLLHVTKIGDNISYLGDTINYTINITNSGDGYADNVLVNDTYSDDFIFVSASETTTDNHTMTISQIKPSESYLVYMALRANVTGILENNVSVLYNDYTSNVEVNDSTNTTVNMAYPNMTLSKTAPSSATTSSTITYTITAICTGNGTCFNTTIYEDYPNGTTFVSSSPSPDNSNNNSWSLGDITSSETITITLTAPSTTGTITNFVNVTYQNYTKSVFTLNNTATTTISAPSTPTGGSGGGSSVSRDKETSTIDTTKITSPTIKKIGPNNKATISVNGITHTISGSPQGKNTAIIVIRSNPIVVYLQKLESKKIDIDNDGYYDVQLILKEIYEDNIDLYINPINEIISIEKIPEEIVRDDITDITQPYEEEFAGEEIEDIVKPIKEDTLIDTKTEDKGISNVLIIVIVFIIILTIILTSLIYYFNNHSKKFEVRIKKLLKMSYKDLSENNFRKLKDDYLEIKEQYEELDDTKKQIYRDKILRLHENIKLKLKSFRI